jgi:hypothetical protein
MDTAFALRLLDEHDEERGVMSHCICRDDVWRIDVARNIDTLHVDGAQDSFVQVQKDIQKLMVLISEGFHIYTNRRDEREMKSKNAMLN